MPIKNIISEKILLPAGDLINNQTIGRCLISLNKSAKWCREEIDAHQNRRLQLLLNHAYTHVPFYHTLFNDAHIHPSDIRTKEDLTILPIVTKEMLKKNKALWLSRNIKKRDLILSSSSGSTGEPFQFYYTNLSESWLKAAAIRAWQWMGYKLGDSYVKLSMNPRNTVIKKIQDLMNNSLYLTSTQLAKSDFLKIYKKILSFNPMFLRCYPVPLHFLAKIIADDTGTYKGTRLKAINTTGSTLHEDVRNDIERVFGVPVFDSYSCEGGTMFAQCPHCHSYHPAEEYAISEFTVDTYTEADKDKPLRHITTDLYNFATPFIRYDTQDYIVPEVNNNADCVFNFMKIKKIKGRDSDILVTPSGKYLIVENFVAYFEWIEEVDQIQIVQNKKDEIVINMVVNSSFNENVFIKIKKYWQEYIGSDVHLDIQILDEIKLTPTGKRRTVIRNPEIKLND